MRPSWSLNFTTATPEIVRNVYPRATASTNSSISSSSPSSSASPSAFSSHPASSESLATSSSVNSSAAIPSSTSSTSSTSSSPSPPPPSSSPPPPPPPSSTSPTITFQASPTTSTSSSSPVITSQTPIPSPVMTSQSSSTSLSSTSANITVTVVVSSNPTNDLSPPIQDTSRQGFFSHTGGVAGTFLVIGLFTTSLFLCFFFWIKRRNRRKRASRSVYMQDNYRSLTQSLDNRQPTPEPRASRRSVSVSRQNSTPALTTHSRNGSTERVPFPLMGRSPYQAEPGEYDPYKPEAVNKVYSNDYAEASEYQKYLNALTD